jgi:hypothetical protein
VNERWDELKEKSNQNIFSEEGIINRQIRSIQTEGFFGDMKENNEFKRFNHRTEGKILKEFMLYVFGKNINKYNRFTTGKIKKFEGKLDKEA